MGGSSEEFRYQAVERRVLEMIGSGAVGPGERLPSLRAMSAKLGLSLSTVGQAYLELEAKGVVEARPRSGYFVRQSFRQLAPPRNTSGSLEAKPVNRSRLILSALQTVGNRDLLPLGVVCPTQELLPTKALTRCMTDALRADPEKGLGYETIEGDLELRRQIAFRGMDAGTPTRPEDLVVTSGAMEALYIALRVLTRPGDNVVIQSPTYYCFLQLMENLGLRAVEIPSHPEGGIDPADVREAVERFQVAACVFSPNFNNPDGSLTPEDAKRDIVRLLAERDIPLVEDDVSGDLHLGPHRPGTCKQFDEKGLVVLCSSFSKTIAPGYRVGWMDPGRFRDRVLEVKATTNVCSATPPQLAVGAYLRSGQYDRHLKRLRAALERQTRALRTHVAEYFPEGTRATDPAGGAVLWIEMPGNVDSVEYFMEARRRGIGIVPGPVFSIQDRFKSFFRISCGGVWTEAIRAGLEILGKMASDMRTDR